jgi:hypothetical protein
MAVDPITPTINRDLRCLDCGYNLRTLAHDGRCPECGLAVFTTLAGGLPVVDTLGRRRTLALACGSLALAMISLLVAPRAGYGAFAFQAEPFVDPGLAYIPSAVCAAIAMIAFARPQNHLDGSPLFVRSRRIMLATAPALPLGILLWEYAYRCVPFDDFHKTYPLLFIPLLTVAPGVLLAFRMLSRIVRPLGLPRFRIPLSIATLGWWIAAPVITLTFSSVIPLFQPLWSVQTPKLLPASFHAIHEAAEVVVAVVIGCGMFLAFVIGIPVLISLSVAFARSRPPADALTLPATVRPEHLVKL